MDKLPIYRFEVGEDDDSEITAVALVDRPAIEMNWQAFNGQFKFVANKEKRIISGPLMIADLPIYRRDEAIGEYYCLFTKEDIYNLRNKFFKNNNSKEVNKMHDSTMKVEGVYMVENFIIDKSRGINAPDGLNLSDGSWFGSYKVDNEEVWNDYIKSGEFKGFSVEGMFNPVKIDEKPLTIIEQVIEIIKNTDI